MKVTAFFIAVLALVSPALATGLIDNSTNANAAAAAAASSSATGGNVGNISNNGGTHIQTVTPIQTNTQTTVVTPVQTNTQVGIQGQAQHQNSEQKNKQSTSVNVDASTDQIRQAPPAVPASLAVSSLTCYGSWSIAASTPFGGVGAGFPTKDADCERSRNAALLNALGYQSAALALMAQNEDTAKALKAAGVMVPGEKKAEVVPDVKPVASFKDNRPAAEPVSAIQAKLASIETM